MSKCGQSGSKNTVAAEERAAKSVTISHNAVKTEKHDAPLSSRIQHEAVKQCVAPSKHTLSSALAAGFATPSLLVYNASSNTLIQFPSPLHLIPPSSSPSDSVSKSDTASTSSEVYQTDRIPFSSSSSAMWMPSPKATDSSTEHSMITKRAVNGSKTIPRLSRLNAVDLTMTGAGIDDDDSFVTGINSKECPATSTLSTATDNNSSSKPGLVHREIEPVPVGVCAAEAAQRVGSCYVCPVCHKMFSSAPQLAIHNNIHFLERSSRCTICRSMFSNRAALERHRRVAHRSSSSALAQDNQDSVTPADGSDPRPYKCNECNVAFRIPGHLAKHRRSKAHAVRVEGRSDIMQTADLDGDEEEVEQVVESSSSLMTISSSASSEDGIGRKSDESVLMVPVTVITADLDQERVGAVSTSVPGSCTVSPPCTGVSTGPKSPVLMIETTEIDRSPPSHKVNESEPDNTRPQPSTDIIISVESSVQLFQHRCTICDKVLPDLNAFMVHVTSHIERRPFVCEHCDAGFTTSRLLEEHRKLHSIHSVRSATHFCGTCNCGSIDCPSSRVAPPCTVVTCASEVPTSDCHIQPAPRASCASLLPSCITDSATSLQFAATSSANVASTLSPCISRTIETELSVSSDTNFDLHSNTACVSHRHLKASSDPGQTSYKAIVSTPSFSPPSVKATETSRSPGTSASDLPTGAVVDTPPSCQSDNQTVPHQWNAAVTVPVTANVGSTF